MSRYTIRYELENGSVEYPATNYSMTRRGGAVRYTDDPSKAFSWATSKGAEKNARKYLPVYRGAGCAIARIEVIEL